MRRHPANILVSKSQIPSMEKTLKHGTGTPYFNRFHLSLNSTFVLNYIKICIQRNVDWPLLSMLSKSLAKTDI